MAKFETTLRLLAEHHPCQDRLKVLLTALGEDRRNPDKPIPIKFILESNGLDDALWALRALTENHDREIRLLACDYAEGKDGWVLALYEKRYPGDNRVRVAIEVSRKFAVGQATREELGNAAAAAHASSAAAAAHASSVGADADATAVAYYAAAAAHASSVAADADATAVAAEERQWQQGRLEAMLNG